MVNKIKSKKRDIQFYRSLPKVELHRHLEGSLRLSTLLEVGRAHGLNLPNTGKLREAVQIGAGEDYTFTNFLSKFQTLRLFYKSPEVIERLVREAIEDAAIDNIRYLELRFTPVALAKAEGFPLNEVMDWVIEGKRNAEKNFDIDTRLIASVNRHEAPSLACQVVKHAADRYDQGIVGLDLAGDEVNFDSRNFWEVFEEAKDTGLNITIHAGEWCGAANVREAILNLNAERIGHGIRVLEDPEVTALARDSDVIFEVCVTSNYQTGAIPSNTVHPLTRMISHGLNVTINTDDPSISQITLSDEYRTICEDLGLSLSELQSRIYTAARASFLPEVEKTGLCDYLEGEYFNINSQLK